MGERIISKLEEVADFPDHFLDSLTNFPGYKLRVGDFRVIVDWEVAHETIYVVTVLRRKHDYRELSGLREVWGTWRE
ncbi:type II toxin-antitoxin system RelE family toxin [Halorussus ruber]|uniref:type II toxin-antitoxin system RelE family toxin n=1 Tax=Halorussus ruber TaxID=1126238 RepID=UPI001B2FED59